MSCKNCSLTFRSLSEERSVDLEARLRSGQRVSSVEAAQVAALSADVRADTDRCDTEISRLHRLIFSLENKRRELKSRENAYTSLLSPIRRLPPEVLGKLFSDCCGLAQLYPSQLPMLFTLSMVCAYWRTVIQSTPSLWSTISANITAMSHLKLMDKYLEYSGQLPLSISVQYCDMDLESITMEHLLHHCHRWRDLDLALICHNVREDTFRSMEGNLPTLERLTLDFVNSEFDDHEGSTAFESAPKLHTLSLHSTSAGMVFPWKQIVHLSLDQIPVKEFLRLVSLCDNLEEVDLSYRHIDGNDDDLVASDVLRTASNLHTLSINMEICGSPPLNGIDFLWSLFHHVTCPSLSTVTITSSLLRGRHDGWSQEAFQDFVSRSACNITSLSFIRIPLSDTDLIATLISLPSLTSLTFEEFVKDPGSNSNNQATMSTVTDTLLQGLTPHSASSFDFSQSLVPHLQTINIHTHASAFSDECFVDMVKSRCTATELEPSSSGRRIACLRSVVLCVSGRAFDRQKFTPLRHLERAGMQICVTDSGGRVE